MTRHNYANESITTTPYVLDDATLLNIGRLVRAIAEIEDIATTYLCRIAKLSEGHAIIMLGRTALSQKLQLARSFANAHGPEELNRFKTFLDNDALKDLIEFRNIVAHSPFIGRANDGRLAFRTPKQIDAEVTHVTIEAVTFGAEDFSRAVMTAETMVGVLELELKTAKARQRRAAEELSPHTKAQTRN